MLRSIKTKSVCNMQSDETMTSSTSGAVTTGDQRAEIAAMRSIIRTRVAPAFMEMIDAKQSFSSPPNSTAYVAAFEGRPEPTLQQFNLPMLDRQKGNGKIQGTAKAV